MSSELDEFKTEVSETLDRAEAALLALDKLVEGQDPKSYYDEVFRALHNIKGTAGMMEWNELQHHVHLLENELMKYKETSRIPKELIGWFLKGSDATRCILNGDAIDFNYDVSSLTNSTDSTHNQSVPDTNILVPSADEQPDSNSEGHPELVTEVTEAMERVSDALLKLENDPHNKELIDSLYRDIHSVKGATELFGVLSASRLAHTIESCLEPIRDNPQTIPQGLVGALLACVDLIQQLAKSPNDTYLNTEATFMQTVLESFRPTTAVPIDPESIPSGSEIPAPTNSASHNVDLTDDDFRISEVRPSEIKRVSSSLETTPSKTQNLTSAADYSQNSATLKSKPDASPTADLKTNDSSHTTISSREAKHMTENKTSNESKLATDSNEKADSTIRVQVSLLDRLMTLMGEMVLVRNQVLQYSNKTDDLEFLNLSQKLDVVTSELQEETMKTRMQPIGNILTKFQRVVRDLSASLGKDIHLNLIGAETELDKSLIESVKDPLTHIVRNSCDHGIETIEDRKKAGKPEQGQLTIRAFHEGGQVVIEITDDGRGLHKSKLVKKAIEKGLITQERAEQMSERDIHALIFAPGFSTAEKITNVSGRGVGMDVVKSNIEKIGGLIDLSSVEGQGTKITLKIPLTLAIVPAMVVRSDKDQYAIPQVKLVELIRVEPNAIEYVQGRPLFRLRGNILPLLSLKEIFGDKSEENEKIQSDAINIVVLNSDNAQFGLIVDEVVDTADIVVKPLARFLKSVGIYSGATVLGDGTIALILDIVGIATKFLAKTNHTDNKHIHHSQQNTGMKRLLQNKEYVLVKLNAEAKHAVPLEFVNRMEEFKTSQIEKSGNLRVLRYRGEALQIVSLNEMLGYKAETTTNDITQIIVTKLDGQMLGLEVNEILDVMSSTDRVDTNIKSHPAVYGNILTEKELIVCLSVPDVYEISSQTIYKTKAHKRNGSARTIKVAVVDDVETVRNRVSNELESQGFEAIAFDNPVNALTALNENPGQFSLVITDIEMPQMNGFDFATQIKNSQKLRHLPVVAFSTKNFESDLTRAREIGFSAFIEKSQIHSLAGTVVELVNENSNLRAAA